MYNISDIIILLLLVSHHDQTFLWFKEWESFIAKSKLVWQLEYNFVFLNRRNVFTFMMKFNED